MTPLTSCHTSSVVRLFVPCRPVNRVPTLECRQSDKMTPFLDLLLSYPTGYANHLPNKVTPNRRAQWNKVWQQVVKLRVGHF